MVRTQGGQEVGMTRYIAHTLMLLGLLLAAASAGHGIEVQTITTVAGNGVGGFSGDGGPATRANVDEPIGVAVDTAGNIFFVDMANARIRRVDAATGIITTVAGHGVVGGYGDGGPALAAAMDFANGIAVDRAGNVYFGERNNHRVRQVDARTGVIRSVAGTGVSGFSGDGGPAAAAQLYWPYGVAVDNADNLLIADGGNHRIRRVDARTRVITTVAGNGAESYSGDGRPATLAAIAYPTGVASDRGGNLFIADYGNQRLRRVDAASGAITTIAGTGGGGFSGDGGPATAAKMANPFGVAVDSTGNVYFGDSLNNRVRRVDMATGVITTVVGNGAAAYAGDGGRALRASLTWPDGVAFDRQGNLLISDNGNNAIRRVSPVAVADPTPFADAGPDQVVPVETVVQLDGSGSGPDGVALTYRWTAPRGLSLSDPSAVGPTFTAGSIPGVALLVLVANDGTVDSEPDTMRVTTVARTAVLEPAGPITPQRTRLRGSYPNPFNATTALVYDLAEDGQVRLQVCDVTGQVVRRLVEGRAAAGRYQVAWDGRDNAGVVVGSGVYLAELLARGYRTAWRMALLR